MIERLTCSDTGEALSHATISQVCRMLRDYEDIGLTPKEISQMQDFANSQCAKMLAKVQQLEQDSALFNKLEAKGFDMSMGYDHIAELLQAEEQDRLVIIPPDRDCRSCLLYHIGRGSCEYYGCSIGMQQESIDNINARQQAVGSALVEKARKQ